jgi:hypothetical protein
MTKLEKRLSKPFVGNVSLYGQNGLYKAMDDDEIIKNNGNI